MSVKSQSYSYDALYQLTGVSGTTVYNPYNSSDPDYKSVYTQTFAFDASGLGNMTSKVSSEKVNPAKKIGDDLNYELSYNYDVNFAHRLVNAGDRYYKYDANGNMICEKDGSFDEETVRYSYAIKEEAENVYSTEYGWGLYAEDDGNFGNTSAYKRTYAWNEKNQLISSIDSNYSTAYVYAQDGQRTNKYTTTSETVYFNKMWTLHTDSGNLSKGGQYGKNIYLGDTRIVTKMNSGSAPTYQEEYYKQYYYHSDHLESASLISDYKGDEYQRLEYTPYGEIWVEKTDNTGYEYLPYKFTGKEMDEETGLYYYGARYLDPKYSLWISTDPALGDYIPAAGKANSKDSSGLPGMGGAFNHINFNLYHYAGNNPVKYVDPDGRINVAINSAYKMNSKTGNAYDYDENIKNTDLKIYKKGCAITAVSNLAATINLTDNPKDINTGSCVNSSGNVDWNEVADKFSLNVTISEDAFTFDIYDQQENDSENDYYTIIKVQYCNDADSPHWVGVTGKETVDGVDYFKVSATSVNDSSVGAGSLRNAQGWKKNDSGEILVPVDKVNAYRVFSKPVEE